MAQMMNKSSSAPRPVALLAVFVIVSLLLCLGYAREGDDGVLHSVQNACSSITSPLQYVGNAASQTTESIETSIDDLTADAETLSGLKEQNAALRELAVQTEEYRQEVERLQNLLNMKTSAAVEGVSAKVIGRSSEAWNQTITLNVGSSSGVTAGMTVLGAYGVAGQVISCMPNSCTVRLLTDPNSGVAVTIQSNRESGVVWGSLDGLLYLKSVDSTVTVQVGDVLITSGMGGSYEKGLTVGTVVKVDDQQENAARTIIVQANASATPLEEVFVVNAGVDNESGSDVAQATEVDTDSSSTSDDTSENASASASASASSTAEAE